MKVRSFSGQRLALMLLTLSAALVCNPVNATDFFLRPTSLSMVDRWTPKLSFFVSNPSDRTIVLRVDTLAADTPTSVPEAEAPLLLATPAEIVLRPGGRRVISLNVPSLAKQQVANYELVVEQLPIIYLKPHETNLPEIMVVTRYIAGIKIRSKETSKSYSLTGFGRCKESEPAMWAGAQY